MPTADTSIRVRLDGELKERVSSKFDRMGMTLSEGVRLFLVKFDEENRLPFELTVPNARLKKAMADQEADKGNKSYGNADELFRDLGL